VQIRTEELLAKLERGLRIGFIQAVRAPRLFAAFDDPRAGMFVEAVRMHGEPAVLGLLEDERKRVERQRGTQPDEAAFAGVEIRLKRRGVRGANAAIDAVGCYDQVRIAVRVYIRNLAFEHQFNAHLFRTALQNVQQPFARDSRESVAARTHDVTLEVDLDVVPMRETVHDGIVRLRIGLLQVLQRRIGKDDAPPERVVRTIALDDANPVTWVALLHQQAEIQARRAAADAYNVHRSS
jgi:hypothetical protein